MKKIFLLTIILLNLSFGLTLEQRVSILEKKVNQLESKLAKIDNSQKKIEKKVQQDNVLICNNLKLVNYYYKYENGGMLQTYRFTYKLKNNYDQPVKYIYGSISYVDNKDHTKMVEDYLKTQVELPPHKIVTLHTNYVIDTGSLAKYLKTTPKKNLDVEFRPFVIEFKNGQKINCK